MVFKEGAVVFHGSAHHLNQIEACAFQPDLASADAGDIEKVIHQLGEVTHLPVKNRERPARLRPAGRGLFEDVDAVANGCQWVTQLVRQQPEKLVLATVGFGQLEIRLAQRLLGLFPLGAVFSQSRANRLERLLGLLQPETEFHILGTQPLVLDVDVFG